MSDNLVLVAPQAAFLWNKARRRIDAALVRYDAWFLVFLAVILALAATIFAGLTIWCVVYQHKHFTGNWHWHWTGVSVDAQCV